LDHPDLAFLLTPGTMLLSMTHAFALAFIFLLSYFHYRYSTSSKYPPFPPGPQRDFLTGNTLNIPFKKPWLKYSDWAEKYGTW